MSVAKQNIILDEDDLDEAIREDLQYAIDHGMVVSNLAYFLSQELGESEFFCKEMALAGMLHDIGKLKLSKYLYGRKKDALSIEEIKYVRMHPTFSRQILENEGFSPFILEAIYHHHENYDGSGYPGNLKGDDIPWGARIIRCCDVFAALVSDRPYREAFDIEVALELMIDEVKNFDMSVFLAFQSLINSSNFAHIGELIHSRNR
ncbi:HD-GYP domain-containing protein [Anaeromicropila populeti]|uniref:HDIG domain-containing protein n=1 Tax=Anaeromicropila populeti TaxID=37658 RepID=A0A1I6IRM3_9FIRM|nr:HD domain-containing phosphohydrolase [Anaeromicropila populeti]SFR69281.1 HDIG domain-containing protein [Anaeromicropila populeti]